MQKRQIENGFEYPQAMTENRTNRILLFFSPLNGILLIDRKWKMEWFESNHRNRLNSAANLVPINLRKPNFMLRLWWCHFKAALIKWLPSAMREIVGKRYVFFAGPPNPEDIIIANIVSMKIENICLFIKLINWVHAHLCRRCGRQWFASRTKYIFNLKWRHSMCDRKSLPTADGCSALSVHGRNSNCAPQNNTLLWIDAVDLVDDGSELCHSKLAPYVVQSICWWRESRLDVMYVRCLGEEKKAIVIGTPWLCLQTARQSEKERQRGGAREGLKHDKITRVTQRHWHTNAKY